MSIEKWLLDTDIGNDNDDCMALGYLLSSKDIELLGVTTVSGEAPRRALFANVMCRLHGVDIPVNFGCEKPLIGQCYQRHMTRTEYEQVDLFPHMPTPANSIAVEFLKETIEKYPHEITLAAIGPLTNVALLFATYPHITALLKSLVVMGGRYFEKAACDVTKWGSTEWNIKCDTYAAAIVFAAQVTDFKAVGVELTCEYHTPGGETADRLASIPCMKPIVPTLLTWENAWYHDAVAIWAAHSESNVVWQTGDIEVVLTSGNEFGSTRFTPSPCGQHKVLVKADKELFYHNFNAVLGI